MIYIDYTHKSNKLSKTNIERNLYICKQTNNKQKKGMKTTAEIIEILRDFKAHSGEKCGSGYRTNQRMSDQR